MDIEKKLLENFNNLFSDSRNASIKKIEKIVHESLGCFASVKDMLESSDPTMRKKGIELAQKMQEKLAEQADKALRASGMDRDAIDAFLENKNNFSSDEWDSLLRAKEELDTYEVTLTSE